MLAHKRELLEVKASDLEKRVRDLGSVPQDAFAPEYSGLDTKVGTAQGRPSLPHVSHGRA